LLPTTRRIARESISRFRRRMKVCARVRPLDLRRVGASVRGWVAHTEHANATAMVKEVLSDLVFSPA
jgi:tetrahydromethanopterin S-methyltransferase subunit A